MKGWASGRLKYRLEEFRKRWPTKSVELLREDILNAVSRMESKTPYTEDLPKGTDVPELFGVSPAEQLVDGVRVLEIGDVEAAQALTFHGAGLTFGQSFVALTNTTPVAFRLYCLLGAEAASHSVVVTVPETFDTSLEVSYSTTTKRLTISLGTNRSGDPDASKNTLALIVAALAALENGHNYFAFGLKAGQSALVLDTAVAAQTFAEPSPFFGDALSVELFGQEIDVVNILPASLVTSVSNKLASSGGAIGSVASDGDMLRGVLRVSGLAFEYFVIASTVSD